MEAIISSRRIEWVRHIVSQLFQEETSQSGEIQPTRKVGGGENRRRKVINNNNNNKTTNNNNVTQTNTKTVRQSAMTKLPVAMGNESFSWEPSPLNNLRSRQMSGKETTTLRNPMIKSKDKPKQPLSASSSSSSWRVSCLLAFIGVTLISITLWVALNPFSNPISQLQMRMQPTIEDTDVSTTGTSILPMENLTMLFLRATGISLLLHATLALLFPVQLSQPSKVALLYGMAVLAAVQALTNHAMRIPCGGMAMVFWFLAGWESWTTWETTTTTTITSPPSSIVQCNSSANAVQQQYQYQKQLLLQYLADDVSQTVLVATVPLLITTLGIPHTLIDFLLQQWQQQQQQQQLIDDNEWATSTLVLAIRFFGICQLAFAIFMMDWKDRMQSSLPQQQQQQQQKSRLPQSYPCHSLFLPWLPLFHMVVVNLPLFLTLVVTMEDTRLGAFLTIAQVGISVWMVFRTVGTLQYTQ